jgi:hypothetical protein
VHANLILALAQAALVTVAPGPDDDCPSSSQVQTALEIHAPRLVTPRSEDDPADQLSLTLYSASPGREMSLSLLDGKGRVRLYRTLPTPPGDRARDCAALADTVAFIVDRYFEEVELPSLPEKKPPPPPPAPAPPPPPPPANPPIPAESFAPSTKSPSFALSGTVGRRMPGSYVDLGGIEFKATLGAELVRVGKNGWPLWLDLSGGVVGVVNHDWENSTSSGDFSGSANAIRSSVDLALLLGRPAGHGKLYLGPLAAVEFVWLDANSEGHTQHEIHTGFAAGLRAGYQYFWRRRFFARADITGCIAIVRQEIVTQSPPNTVIFAAPPAFATGALGVGIWF